MNSYTNYTFEIRNPLSSCGTTGKLIEIANTPANFFPLLDRVGGPWGWDRRPKYLHPDLTDRRLFLLAMPEYGTVGYAMTHKDEIENFGLFPEHTGKGIGGDFFPLVVNKVFEEHDKAWLTTRSTNHAKVPKFYADMGMTLKNIEELPDDLVMSYPSYSFA